MEEFESNKIYKPSGIPGRQQVQAEMKAMSKEETTKVSPLNDNMFYEIEYDSCPMPGVGKFVLKSQKIEPAKKDEKRELFGKMREIAGSNRPPYDSSRFFEYRVKQYNARIFYKQGIFMKDFSDDFTENKALSQYFPNYQMMGYEQLRTYFTWRTKVRQGNVTNTSLSYGFLYIYELLNNIGVNDPLDGLNKLLFFWKEFSPFNPSIDKYVLKWFKDYHIYYQLPHTFKEFIDSNNLTLKYPNMVNTKDDFEFYCGISKYDIRKSSFYEGDNKFLIKDCFQSVIQQLRIVFENNGISFDEAIFQPTKKMKEWEPFKDALFYPWKKQVDRRIVLSENEIYVCNNNKWGFNASISSDDSRQLIAYIMKQIEAVLRKLTKYKYKLTANMEGLSHEAVLKLKQANVSLESIIMDTVTEVYKEATKTVVTVDLDALSRIRQEALTIQEKLVVKELETQTNSMVAMQITDPKPNMMQNSLFIPNTDTLKDMVTLMDKPDINPPLSPNTALTPSKHNVDFGPAAQPDAIPETAISDSWQHLSNELSDIERNALAVILNSEMELKKYADQYGIMVEVLVEGINEKAMDLVGDSLIDEEFMLYEDYIENVKELIK